MGVLMSAVAGLYRHIRNHLAELVAVRTHELAGANARLSQQVEERTRAAEELRNSRAAALNLMEDAIRARRQTEEAAADLRESEERLRVATGQPPRYNIQVESETT